MEPEMKPAEQATELELLMDIIEPDSASWSSLQLLIDSDGKYMVSDFFSDIFGTGENLREALIDFMLNYWEQETQAPGSYGLHSGLIDWSNLRKQRRILNDV